MPGERKMDDSHRGHQHHLTIHSFLECQRFCNISDPFPVRLHDLLTELESDVHSEHRSIYWQPHGRAFRIHDKDRFQEEILPK